MSAGGTGKRPLSLKRPLWCAVPNQFGAIVLLRLVRAVQPLAALVASSEAASVMRVGAVTSVWGVDEIV